MKEKDVQSQSKPVLRDAQTLMAMAAMKFEAKVSIASDALLRDFGCILSNFSQAEQILNTPNKGTFKRKFVDACFYFEKAANKFASCGKCKDATQCVCRQSTAWEWCREKRWRLLLSVRRMRSESKHSLHEGVLTDLVAEIHGKLTLCGHVLQPSWPLCQALRPD